MTDTITIVYRNVTPAEAVALGEHPKARASSWSDLMEERDRIERNRDMWKDQCAAQAQQIAQYQANDARWREVRYQLKKEFGDRWVHVVDRNTGETVERFDILNDDGQALATAMCDRLNGRAAASGAAQGDDHAT